MSTIVSKDCRNNWSARDEIDIGNSRVLTISTSKNYSGNLNTYATVGTREHGMISHMVYQDFSKCIYSRSPARITARAVAEQHAEAIEQLEDIKSRVIAHYKDPVLA